MCLGKGGTKEPRRVVGEATGTYAAVDIQRGIRLLLWLIGGHIDDSGVWLTMTKRNCRGVYELHVSPVKVNLNRGESNSKVMQLKFWWGLRGLTQPIRVLVLIIRVWFKAWETVRVRV